MLPSSRPREGEPLRCPMCGASRSVEGSRPPGDSECPSCGSHAWFPQRVDGIEATKAQIRAYVEGLSALCRKDLPVHQSGEFLVVVVVTPPRAKVIRGRWNGVAPRCVA